MKNILSVFEDNLNGNIRLEIRSKIDLTTPYYIISKVDTDRNEDFEFGSATLLSNNRNVEINDDTLISLTKNFLDRLEMSTISFEEELRLYKINLDRYSSGTLVYQKVSDFLKSLVRFYLKDYQGSASYFKLVNANDLKGTFWHESYNALNRLLKYHTGRMGNPYSVNNLSLLLSRCVVSLSDAVQHYHIHNQVRGNFKNVEIFHSLEYDYKTFLNLNEEKEIVFLMSHGNNVNGLKYYKCKESNSNVVSVKDVRQTFTKAKLLFFVGCTQKPYEALIKEFDYIGIPLSPNSSFEYGEMFIVSFLQTYSLKKDINMGLLSGQLCGKLFRKKLFEFGIFEKGIKIHDL